LPSRFHFLASQAAPLLSMRKPGKIGAGLLAESSRFQVEETISEVMHISRSLERSLYAKGNTQGGKARMLVQFEDSDRSEKFTREERMALISALAMARDTSLDALETFQDAELRNMFVKRSQRYEELRYKLAFDPDKF
jgi:hypothetical protein